ncbi:Integral membrane sensor signal transduction histidine kinase [Candidatus Sulfobium mesophilum]|uniref:histidine kinase n=1 Tax=Candidatus Sulfobium mesophilum TaxID=2016548 RepID=A0A2U3QHL7_9BACT|nr:Integral membrane sensor signal transduction histidine kinase [Candidatus Sulfobium mesophilum]
MRNLKIKWKILLLVLPLVVIPIIVVGNTIGYVATRQAYRGITDTSKADLDHMTRFTIDLLRTYDEHFGSYRPDESDSFKQQFFTDIRKIIKEKKVGATGYIYCLDGKGMLTIHPAQEGVNISESVDFNGNYFIREMLMKKTGWIRYPWKNPGDKEARMKIVRYIHFEPWDWIVAVGSYENEFYSEANLITRQILRNVILVLIVSMPVSVILVFYLSSKLTNPIRNIMEVVRDIKKGRTERRIKITGSDEIGELAGSFNRMVEMIERNKEMEKALNQQAKMASLGVLSSKVAHEINNPLGVILGYTSYLEGKVPADSPVYRYVLDIKNESRRCKKIVEDLLSYARVPAPKLETKDLNAILGEIVRFASNLPETRNVEILTQFVHDLPPVMVDEDQMYQVAINLILNAAAATEGNGRILIGTEFDPKGEAIITFGDTGCGISHEHLEKIFEPFFTTKPKGTGLGLAITKQIIKQHLGTIVVESIVGLGTKFTIRLPAAEEQK